MGTWDTGPFDNDSAADFAADVQARTGPDARHDLLLATMRAGASYLSSVRLTNEYAWGYEVEHAVAAAAFVADEYTGVKQFTNCSYARGVDDNMELNPYVEFHLTPELLDAARKLTDMMLCRMKSDYIDDEWIAPVQEIRTALNNQTFHATATWEGKWWVVQIGGLPDGMVGTTQGRTKDDAKSMATEVVALLLDVDESEVEIDMTYTENS